MPKPEVIDWAKNAIPGLEIIKPPQNKINIGWIQEKPPYQFFNWLFRQLGLWTQYINDELQPNMDLLYDLVPLGTILPFYDFDGLLSFNPDFFTYCDGKTIDDPKSPLHGKTLRDLSHRYLVGFGSEDGKDMGSALFAEDPVGNPNHQIDLEHSHSVDAHSHSISHTHMSASHNHGPGSLQFQTGSFLANGQLSLIGKGVLFGSVALPQGNPTPNNIPNYVPGNASNLYTGAGSGLSALGGYLETSGPSEGLSGLKSPGTNKTLSKTQSIQPRSIRVRFIMRYK